MDYSLERKNSSLIYIVKYSLQTKFTKLLLVIHKGVVSHGIFFVHGACNATEDTLLLYVNTPSSRQQSCSQPSHDNFRTFKIPQCDNFPTQINVASRKNCRV